MKKTLTVTILCALAGLAYAGTESYAGKEVMQQAQPSCDWYRANEWNLQVWGTYAFSFNTGIDAFRRTSDFDGQGGPPEDTGTPPGNTDPDELIDIGQYHNDRFLNRDAAWGGGGDIKYFFNKYWALGVNGFVLDCNDNTGGGGTATVTIRFPIGCSRFAPYAFGGFGLVGGGSHSNWLFHESHFLRGTVNGPPFIAETEGRDGHSFQNKDYEVLGQFGAGLEYRVTRHIGIMTDFVYNAVGDGSNDFGMGRFGVTLSY